MILKLAYMLTIAWLRQQEIFSEKEVDKTRNVVTRVNVNKKVIFSARNEDDVFFEVLNHLFGLYCNQRNRIKSCVLSLTQCL